MCLLYNLQASSEKFERGQGSRDMSIEVFQRHQENEHTTYREERASRKIISLAKISERRLVIQIYFDAVYAVSDRALSNLAF